MIRDWAKPETCACHVCLGRRAGNRINPAYFATIIVRGLTQAEYGRLSAMTDAGMLED